MEDHHLSPMGEEHVSHKHLRPFVFDCLPFQRSEKLYVPHVWPNIPSNEAVIMWDKFKHHYLQPILDDQGKTYSPTEPAQTPPLHMRILALVLMCIMIWGGGMCYASVGAMTSLIEDEYNISVSQLGQLYSIYSLPTMFSVFFAGYLSDRIGINICALSYTGLVLLGSFIAAAGNSYIAMMIGRFLYGLGNESAGVVQSALVGRWYSHDSKMSLSLTMAITLSFYRASSFMSMSVLPSIASVGLHFCLWVLFIAAGLSFIATIGLVYIDRKYKDYLHVATTGEPISIKDVRKFSAEFWVMAFVTFFFYAAILTFFTISNDFLQDKWGYSLSTAGLISSVIYLTPAVCVPFLGYFTDHVGQRCKLMLISSALIVPSYLILAYTHIPAVVGTFMLGLAYSILPVCLWAGVALIMPTNILGTAYGVLTSLLNTGSFVSPLIVTSIKSSTNSYTTPILFLLSLGCAAFVLCIVVYYLDTYKSNGVLEHTSVLKARDKKE